MKEVTKKHLKGYAYLLATIVLYVTTPFLIKEIYNNKASKFEKPFFISYFCTSCYVLYILPLVLQRYLWRSSRPSPELPLEPPASSKLSDKRIMFIAIVLGIISVAHSYIFNLAVHYTSVASNFILHDTSDLFVFVFCLIFLGWSFSWIRFSAIFISGLGVFLIAYSDSGDTSQSSPLIGDMFSLISTVLYGLWITLTKMYIEDEDSMDWNKFFYYTGISTAVLWLPFLLFLHLTGIEEFEWPNWPTFAMLLANGILGYVLPDYTFSLSTVLLDPLLVDLGLGVLSPISMVLDYYYENKTFDVTYLSGYGFVLLAFVILVLYDIFYEMEEEAQKVSDDGKELTVLVD